MQQNYHLQFKCKQGIFNIKNIIYSGYLQQIIYKDGTTSSITAMYANTRFEQHCTIPAP